MKQVKRARLLAIAGVLLITTACSNGGGDDSDSQAAAVVDGGLDQVCAEGAKEGKFTLWNDQVPELQQQIFDAFTKKYPGIKPEFLAVDAADAQQRLITEAQARRDPDVDLVYQGPTESIALHDAEIVNEDIDWAALGVADELILNGTVRFQRTPIGLVYNTQKVNKADLPKTYEEMVNPKWKGKVVISPENPLHVLSAAWGKDKTVDWVKRLVETIDPVVIAGGTAGITTVASGENTMTLNGREEAMLEIKAKGAPIDIHYLDLIPAADAYYIMPKKAPNPNAAACFAAWSVSEEGQKATYAATFSTNNTVPPGAPAGAKVVAVVTREQSQTAADTAKETSRIISGS